MIFISLIIKKFYPRLWRYIYNQGVCNAFRVTSQFFYQKENEAKDLGVKQVYNLWGELFWKQMNKER